MSCLALHPAVIQPLQNAPARTFPLMAHCVHAGFPSPAGDYVERRIDLNRELIQHPEATFFLRAQGRSMVDAGIHDGDVVIVEKGANAGVGDMVVAIVDNEFTLKHLDREKTAWILRPANPAYPVIRPQGQLELFGVVVGMYRKYR